MSGLTVKDLYKLCAEEIKSGNGGKKILLSDDDEGNGFHHLFYSFSNVEETIGNDDYLLPYGADKENFIILG